MSLAFHEELTYHSLSLLDKIFYERDLLAPLELPLEAFRLNRIITLIYYYCQEIKRELRTLNMYRLFTYI